MNKNAIHSLLMRLLRPAVPPYPPPSGQDWLALERRLGISFPSDFINFHELLCGFEFPGDIYNISATNPTNGNDLIADVFDAEIADSAWPRWLIPFYGIGNGDYFGLDARAGENTPVYYWYHERKAAEFYCKSFDEWLAGVEEFLAG